MLPPEIDKAITKNAKKRKLSISSFDGFVQVSVGPEQKLFNVHKRLLCESSKYFKAAFEGGFKESKDDHIELPDEDATTFKHFQLWLYSNLVDLTVANGIETKRQKCKVSIELFIFADKFGIPDLQNVAMDSIVDSWDLSNADMIPLIYDSTASSSSPLRRFVVNFFILKIHRKEPSCFDKNISPTYPHDFLLEVVMALSPIVNDATVLAFVFPSSYHV